MRQKFNVIHKVDGNIRLGTNVALNVYKMFNSLWRVVFAVSLHHFDTTFAQPLEKLLVVYGQKNMSRKSVSGDGRALGVFCSSQILHVSSCFLLELSSVIIQ